RLIEPVPAERASFSAATGLACAIAAVIPRRMLFVHSTAVFSATLVLGLSVGRSTALLAVGAAAGNVCAALTFRVFLDGAHPGVRALDSRGRIAWLSASATVAALVGATAEAPFF